MNKLKCILLIDDDQIANSLNHFIIQGMEISDCIDIVTDGLEGLHYLKNNAPPNLILLDLNMPIVDGFEFLDSFQKIQIKGKGDIKIVVLSSSSRPADITRALKLGALDYIEKPVKEAKLEELVYSFFR